MDKQYIFLEKIKQIPLWIRSLVTFFALIFSFITLILNNKYLAITVLVALLLCSALCFCVYIAFSKKKSEIADRYYVYRFPKYRFGALIGIFLLTLVLSGLLAGCRRDKLYYPV